MQSENGIEAVEQRIGELVHERQLLRARGAGIGILERNRLAIVAEQWKLSRALIAHHLPLTEAQQDAA